jgi:hypothetical protein
MSYIAPRVVTHAAPGHRVLSGLTLRAFNEIDHTAPLWPLATHFAVRDLRGTHADPERGDWTGSYRREKRLNLCPDYLWPAPYVRWCGLPDRRRFVLVARPGGGPGLLWGCQTDYADDRGAALVRWLEAAVGPWAATARALDPFGPEWSPVHNPYGTSWSTERDLEDDDDERLARIDAWWHTEEGRPQITPWWIDDEVPATIGAWTDAELFVYTRDPAVEDLLRRFDAALDTDQLALGMVSAETQVAFSRRSDAQFLTTGGLYLGDATVASSDEATTFPVRSGFGALRAAAEATGIERTLRNAECVLDEFTPVWTHYPLPEATDHPTAAPIRAVVYPVSNRARAGLFSIEELRAWAGGAGPVLDPEPTIQERLAREHWPALPDDVPQELRNEHRPRPTPDDLAELTRLSDELGIGRATAEVVARGKMIAILRAWPLPTDPPLPVVGVLRDALTTLSDPASNGIALLVASYGVGLEESLRWLPAERGLERVVRHWVGGGWEHDHARRAELAAVLGDTKRWPSVRAAVDRAVARNRAVHRIGRAIAQHPADLFLFAHPEHLGRDGLQDLFEACASIRDASGRRPGPQILLRTDDVRDALWSDWAAHFPEVPLFRVPALSPEAGSRYLVGTHAVFAEGCAELGFGAFAALASSTIRVVRDEGIVLDHVMRLRDAYAMAFWSAHGLDTPLAWDRDLFAETCATPTTSF